jgi:hypothetical protein
MSKFAEYLKESKVNWTIEKFADEEAYKIGKSYEVSKFDGNVMLNAGITVLLQLLATNDAPNQYNNANAQIGVGDTPTPAADPSQTGLQAPVNKAYAGMVIAYPTVVDQTVTFKASFAAGEANFNWREFVVINSATADTIALNRKVENQGTKIVGQVWEITLAITLA